RDRAAAQRPEEALVPVLLLLGRDLGAGERMGDALVGVVDARVDRLALLGLQPVLLVPDVVGGGLQRDVRRAAAPRFEAHSAHLVIVLPVFLATVFVLTAFSVPAACPGPCGPVGAVFLAGWPEPAPGPVPSTAPFARRHHPFGKASPSARSRRIGSG